MNLNLTPPQADDIAELAHSKRIENSKGNAILADELNRPWPELNPAAKAYERGTVKAVIEALEAKGYAIGRSGDEKERTSKQAG